MASAKYLSDVMLCVHRVDVKRRIHIEGRIDGERRCPGVQVCCNIREGGEDVRLSESPSPSPAELPPPDSCGIRGVIMNSNLLRIFSEDNLTQFGEFPWMLALLRGEEPEGGGTQFSLFQCGASLIHPQVALTAAHCVSRYFVHILFTLHLIHRN